MPTYDYECDSCGHRFELFQKMGSTPQEECPECGRLELRRLIGSGGAVIFKGSGFYQTDYRSEEYKRRAREDSKKPEGQKSESSSGDEPGKSSGGGSNAKRPVGDGASGSAGG